MDKKTLFLHHANGVLPFVYPALHIFKNGNFFKGIFQYWKEVALYRHLDPHGESGFPLLLSNTRPMYFDRYDEAGSIPRHYFLMDLWAAKKVFRSKTKLHYDIGSRLDSFVSHCLVFCKVVMLDVRPLTSTVPGLTFKQADCRDMKHIPTSSVSSLSSLHAFEHFGLGRYGDPVDPFGHEKAIAEVQRIVKKGGDIYFATPIGRQRIEFNAHRVFDPRTILRLFDKCELIESSVIDDKDVYKENVDIKKYARANYSCGLFHFRKR